MNDLPVEFRLGTPSDIPYVANSWFLSNRNNHNNGFIENSIYEAEQTALIKKLLDISMIFVAHIEDEPNAIIAYQVYQYLNGRCIIHYANTKGSDNLFRNKGIQSSILELINPDNKLQLIITSFPRKEKMFLHLKEKYSAIYDPYFLMRLS